MMRLKRKQFALPAVLPILGNVAMGTMTAGSLVQGANAASQNEEMMQQQRIAAKKQNKALRQIAEAAEKNPLIAQSTVDTMQRSYSVLGNIGGFAKDMGKFAWGRKKEIAGGLLSGAAIAGVGYGVDRAIQHDAKKNNIPVLPEQQRTYATPGIGARSWRFAKDVVKENWKMGLGFGALMGMGPAMGYLSEKQQYKDQLAQTQRQGVPQQKSYSVMANVGKFFRSLKNPRQLYQNTKKSIQSGWQSFKADPAVKTVDATTWMMGGGKQGRENLVNELTAIGNESGNVITKNVAGFLDKHKKTASLAAGGVGAAIMGAGWGQGENLTKKALKAADKDAFKYQESKEAQIPQQ